MNANEIFEMTLNELTVKQFVVVMFTILICTALAVIIFFTIFEILQLIVDFVFFCFRKTKRLGGWWFKRDVCRYMGRLKHQTIKAPTEKAYYLYYNRLIGAAEVLNEYGIIDDKLYLKFAVVPSYADLNPNYYMKGSATDETGTAEERTEVDQDQ